MCIVTYLHHSKRRFNDGISISTGVRHTSESEIIVQSEWEADHLCRSDATDRESFRHSERTDSETESWDADAVVSPRRSVQHTQEKRATQRRNTMRDLVRFWYGFTIAEDGDRLFLLSKRNPVYVITTKTPSQKRLALNLLCAVADGNQRVGGRVRK